MDLETRILSETEVKNMNKNYLYSAIEKDERCIEFFYKFRLFYDREISRKSRRIKEIEDELFKLLEKIEKTGVDIRNNVLYYKAYSLGIGIGYENFKKVLFNNLSFDEENLEYLRKVIKWNVLPPEEPFKKEYNEWYAENRELQKEYDEIIKQLEKLSKQKVRTTLFADKKELENLYNRRNVLNNILATGEEKRIRAERFKKLSFEQLKLIYEYYQLLKELESKSIGNLEKIGIQLAYPTALNKEEVKTVLNKMIETDSNLRGEFLHAKLVILKNYLSYQFDADSFCDTNISSDNKILIANFIITVSDEINELYLEFTSNLDKDEILRKK